MTVLWSRSRHVGRPRPVPTAELPPELASATRPVGELALLVAQAPSLATFLALVAFAWFGPRSIGQNLAPLAIVGVIWSLGGWVALVAGPIWSPLSPVAASVLLAQELTVGLVEAQNLVVLASDPLARGWNMFGTVFWEVSQQPLSPFVGGIVQAIVILAGHLAAIGAIGRAATARAVDGTTSPRARNQAWTASLPAMAVVTASGVVWTMLRLGR